MIFSTRWPLSSMTYFLPMSQQPVQCPSPPSWWIIIIIFLTAVLMHLKFSYLFFFPIEHNHPPKFNSKNLKGSRGKQVFFVCLFGFVFCFFLVNRWPHVSSWLCQTILFSPHFLVSTSFVFLSAQTSIISSLLITVSWWPYFPFNQDIRNNLNHPPTSVTE